MVKLRPKLITVGMDIMAWRLLYLTSLGVNFCCSAPLQYRTKIWTRIDTNWESVKDKNFSPGGESELYISAGHLRDSQHSDAVRSGVQARLDHSGHQQAEVKAPKLSQSEQALQDINTDQALQDINQVLDEENRHFVQLRERSVHKTQDKTKRVAVKRFGWSDGLGTDFARSDALSHEVHDTPKEYKASEMVISIAGTLAVLFSMGMLFAIFHCCCRKKRQNEESEEEISGKSTDKKTDKNKTEEDLAVHGNIQKSDSESEADDNDNKTVSVKSKIKAFEVKKKEESSPEMRPSPGHLRKRPESDAFKAFESKGILIGMGRSPRKVAPENLDEKEEEEEDESYMSSPEGARKVMLDGPSWLSPTVKATKAANDDVHGSVSENPDVVVDTVDDDREFDAIQRESEVLRSYRKAAPPRNRQKPTRGSKKRNNKPSTESTSTIQSETETAETEDIVDSNIQTVIADVEPLSDSTNLRTSDSPKIVPKETYLDNAVSSTQGKSDFSEYEKKVADNIFYQIDPTVKYKSTSDITGPGPAGQSQSEEEKPHRQVPSQNHDLVNALKRKLKDTETDETNRSSTANDELEPLIRERTHSAPTSPKHETHL